MFAKFRARVIYPEIAYCAWLGILPAMILGTMLNTVLGVLLGSPDSFETFIFYANATFFPGLFGMLIGGLAHNLRRNSNLHWIQLSFLVPFLTVIVYFLFEFNWDLQSLVSDKFFVSIIFGSSLCSSVTAILVRSFLNISKPILPPAVAGFAP